MPPLYDEPIRILIQHMLSEFEGRGKTTFTRAELFEWFRLNYPKAKKNSLHSHLNSLSTNSPSRVNNGVDESDDILFKLDRISFRRYDPLRDPPPVYTKEDLQTTPADLITQALRTEEQSLDEQGEFDANNDTDARKRVMASIVRRQGQSAFRQKLLAAYSGECCISECDIERVLDAAHILPYRGDHTDHVTNGLLLRTDLHTLFDLGLIAIDAKRHEVVISNSLNGSDYELFRGKKIALPDDHAQRPDTKALEMHRANSQL
jgi:hypothetical protein